MRILTILFTVIFLSTANINAQEKIKIACIGNSLTEGMDNYPTPLSYMLGDKYEVGNFGKWGHTLLKKGDHPYMSTEAFTDAQKFQPNIVIIKLGTNDSKPENWKHKDEFESDLRYMIQTFRQCASKPEIILCRCIPASNNLYGIRDEVIVNEIYPIQQKVAKDLKLKLVDLYTPLKHSVDSTHYVWDNVHVNPQGAYIIAQTIYKAITGKPFAAEKLELTSPNGVIKVDIALAHKIFYTIAHNQNTLLRDCEMSLDMEDEQLGINPKLTSSKRYTLNEENRPVVPMKFSTVKNHCNILAMNFKGNYSVEFRAYNDGVAYRFITKKGKKEIFVPKEEFTLHMPGDYQLHLQQTNSFKTSYEHPYSHTNIKDWKSKGTMCVLPALIDTKKGYKILVSESDLRDYPCMFLKPVTDDRSVSAIFPKVPLEFGDDGDRSLKILKEGDYIARTSATRTFPWRYFVITREDGQLVENTMSYNLASPCALTDTEWIKPGQVSWEWWNCAAPYGVDFVSGFNQDTYKYYIEFASKFGIPYIIMDEGWAKSTRDPYTPNETIDLKELIQYGKEHNVKIVLWLTWLTVENHFDLFKTFADWGIAGVKIDFMDRSDQWMVNYYERVAKEAAKNKLFVDFHGAFKPAGLERAYPNILSYEGVLGMEQGGFCKPENNIYHPFMRNAVGPMDYTPGAMITMQPESYANNCPNKAAIGTRANQLALFVVFESGLQMLADNPTLYYREKECTDFITKVPVTWDETKALKASVGEYLIVAKRKGAQWFIGGITGDKAHELEINLDFLTPGKAYEMTSFEDGINANRQAMDYRKRTSTVRKGDNLKINLARNGGFAAVIK